VHLELDLSDSGARLDADIDHAIRRRGCPVDCLVENSGARLPTIAYKRSSLHL
jgi:hypothetical protein